MKRLFERLINVISQGVFTAYILPFTINNNTIQRWLIENFRNRNENKFSIELSKEILLKQKESEISLRGRIKVLVDLPSNRFKI